MLIYKNKYLAITWLLIYISRDFRNENSDCNRKYSETETLMKTGEEKEKWD
jgi:hypothetical protein